jgi:hypothetical protein
VLYAFAKSFSGQDDQSSDESFLAAVDFPTAAWLVHLTQQTELRSED